MTTKIRSYAADATSPKTRMFARLLLFAFALAFVWVPATAMARAAPTTFADMVEKLLPAVVNISTTQKVAGRTEEGPQFEFPPGSPFRDFFE